MVFDLTFIKKKIKEEYQGECLSDTYTDYNEKLIFKCLHNHTFYKSFRSINYFKSWCVECKKNEKINKKINDYYVKINNYIELKKGKCIKADIKNSLSLVTIKCNNDHIWTTNINKILYKSAWCRKCYNLEKKYTIDEIKEIAKKKGGECLSTSYENINSKLIWKCNNGHIWNAKLPSINCNDNWCPTCNYYIGEEITRNIFNSLFNTIFIKTRPKWLNGLELDGYNKELSLAFEYNGIQHYKYIEFFNKKKSLDDIMKNDSIKKEICTNNNINLIVIPYDIKYEDIKDNIIKTCKNLNIYIPNANADVNLDEIKKLTRNILYKIQNIVESKKGNLLTDVYINNLSALKIKCNFNHEFITSYKRIKMGNWCPECAKKKKHTIEEMYILAKNKNGECLSSVYLNNSTKLKWKCDKNHIWETVPKVILNGHWCRKCNPC